MRMVVWWQTTWRDQTFAHDIDIVVYVEWAVAALKPTEGVVLWHGGVAGVRRGGLPLRLLRRSSSAHLRCLYSAAYL